MARFLLLLLSLLALPGGAKAAPLHPTIPGAPPAPRPLAPAVLDGATFYAHGADLLGLDAEGTHIVRRVRLSGRIGEVRSEGGLLHVVLTPRAEGPVPDRLALPGFRPEAPPARGFYAGGLGDSLIALREARAVALGWDLDGPTTFDAAKMKAAVLGLVAWEAIDRTNPYPPAIRGELLRRLGDEPGALAAFDAAADLPLASPYDLLRVSTLLEDQLARAPAERAFARGAKAARFSDMESQVAAQVLLGVPRLALARAIGTADVAEVHRLVLRQADLFPAAEGGARAYPDLAAWMQQHGRADLAAEWTRRAAIARQGLPARLDEIPAAIDRRVPLVAGFSLVLPLVAFAVGMRRGARALDRRRALADALGLLFVLGALGWFSVDVAARLQALGRASSVPLTLIDGASFAPDAERWALDHLVASPEQATVLAELRRGVRPTDDALARAIARPDLRRAFGAVLSADPALPAGGGLRVPHSLVAAAALFAFGHALGARSRLSKGPPRWFLVARVTPGGPTGLGPIGGVLAALAVGGALSLLGTHAHLADVAAPEATRYYGLETIARAAPPPDLRWAWIAIVAWALLHALAVRIDKKRLARAATVALVGLSLFAPREARAWDEKPGQFVVAAHADLLAGASLGSGFEQCPCESRRRPFGGTVGGRAGYDFDFGFVFEIDAAYQYGVTTAVVRQGVSDEVRTSGLVVSVAGGMRLPVQRVQLHALLGIGAWMGIVSASRPGLPDEQVETTAPLLAPGLRVSVPLVGPLRAGLELGAWVGVANDAEVRGQRAMGWFLLAHGSAFVGVAL